ncbi:HmuY family protein [Colwellia sp. E2M01]|uniref:HmuY family protein n=1 Tax=Colwellia sp. E2M01 TaxID=2841561 RepID=UPI001C0A32FE|nr:HmuY family protein [Colwellia sp. E2M01]MBU2871684.1 HmuY family protein [Colwellia sp. E2M01]
MNNKSLILTSILASLALTACGSSDTEEKLNDVVDQIEDVIDGDEEIIIYGPYSTGTASIPASVYFDLDTMEVVTLTDEEAKTDTQWDIAFNRTDIYLNNADADAPVSVYFTGNNSDFFDEEGAAIANSFINATPETELEDFEAVMLADVPSDETSFIVDENNRILDGFYVYNTTTHVVTADDTHAFIVDSDGTYSKFRATSITTSELDLTEITLTYSNQTDVDTAFATAESDVVIDIASACAGFDGVYVDFELGQVVSASDNWDVTLPCNEAKTGASFEINLADDATAMQDFDNTYDAIDIEALRYYEFEENEYNVRAFDTLPWYQYGLDGGHIIWSQYGVYIINTATASYKLQITSYYNADAASGNYSFRAEALK